VLVIFLGWEYAHDFPRNYSRIRTWYSNVRRRRWIRIRKLKVSQSSENDSNEKRSTAKKKKELESTEEFILSFSTLTLQQRAFHHQLKQEIINLDAQRSWFRKISWRTPSKLNFKHKHNKQYKAANTPNDYTSSAESSLLTYFHIVEDQFEQNASNSLSSARSNLQRKASPASPYSADNAVSSLSPAFARSLSVYAAKSHSLTRVASNNNQERSTLQPVEASLLSPSNAPSIHNIRLHDLKLLLTIEIRNSLVTLFDQYNTTVTEIIDKQKDWFKQQKLSAEDKNFQVKNITSQTESSKMNSTQLPLFHSTLLEEVNKLQEGGRNSEELLFSPKSARSSSITILSTVNNIRRNSFSNDNEIETAARNRPRELQLSPSYHQQSHLNSPSLSRSQSSAANIKSAKIEILHYESKSQLATVALILELTNLQPHRIEFEFNIYTETCMAVAEKLINYLGLASAASNNNQIIVANEVEKAIEDLRAKNSSSNDSIVVLGSDLERAAAAECSEVSDFFSVEIINPQLNVHSDETRGRILFMMEELSVYGRIHWKSVVNNKLVEQGAVDSALSTLFIQLQQQRIRDKFHVTSVVSNIQAFVSPTDIDVAAGIVWFSKASDGILKPIMFPYSFIITAIFNPDLFPLANKANNIKPLQANTPERNLPLQSPNINLNTLNSLDIQFPVFTFQMDAFQFALFIDVLKTISSPPPLQSQALPDQDAEEFEGISLAELKKALVANVRALLSIEWSMRYVEWLLCAIQELNSNAKASPATNYSSDLKVLLNQIQQYNTETNRAPSPSSATNNNNISIPTTFDSSAASNPLFLWLYDISPYVSSNKRLQTETKLLEQDLVNLMKNHSQTSGDFLALLLQIKLKEKEEKAVYLQHTRLSLYIDKVNYTLIKNQSPFLNLFVEGLSTSLLFHSDLSVEISAEIRALGGSVLYKSHDANEEKKLWSELIQPLQLNSSEENPCQSKEVMIHLQALKRENSMEPAGAETKLNQSEISIAHAELNIHPLNIKLTYETLSSCIEFFVDERASIHKQYKRMKRSFLPLGATVLDSDTTHNIAMNKTKEPHTKANESKRVADSANSNSSLSPLTTLKKAFLKYSKPNKKKPSISTGFGGLLTPSAAAEEDATNVSPVSSDGEEERSTALKRLYRSKTIHFNHIRCGKTHMVISYWGNKQNNIEDFQGLVVKINKFQVQNKHWTMQKFLDRLKSEYLRILLGQVGDTLGSFLSYKLGFSRAYRAKLAAGTATVNEDSSGDELEETINPNNTQSIELTAVEESYNGRELSYNVTSDNANPSVFSATPSAMKDQQLASPSMVSRTSHAASINSSSTPLNCSEKQIKLLFGQKAVKQRLSQMLPGENSHSFIATPRSALSNRSFASNLLPSPPSMQHNRAASTQSSTYQSSSFNPNAMTNTAPIMAVVVKDAAATSSPSIQVLDNSRNVTANSIEENSLTPELFAALHNSTNTPTNNSQA
jgi:hypothetical protein